MIKCCKKCIMPETRPRLTFDNDGVCAACEWHEIKKTIDWDARREELTVLCDQIRGKQLYDCIVPVSGGKDSTYVAHKMKHEYKLNILTVTITPPLETKIIQDNLTNFLSYGYDNMKVTPNPVIAQQINKLGLIEQGRPLLSWTTCLSTVMMQIAVALNIPLIMFGEEGESEYGGSTKLRYTPYYDVADSIDLYLYGNDPKQYARNFPPEELKLWQYPHQEEVLKSGIKIAHWSYYENWDPYRNYLFAKDNYGMQIRDVKSIGTYTNFSQMDTPLYDLHTYFMYLKFGFGRCLQDACIDLRNGRMTRDEALGVVEQYDGAVPNNFFPLYLDYYKMTQSEFDSVLQRHTNLNLFKYEEGKLIKKFCLE